MNDRSISLRSGTYSLAEYANRVIAAYRADARRVAAKQRARDEAIDALLALHDHDPGDEDRT